MPSGVYKRTKKHKDILSKNSAHYWLGKKRPEISILLKGRKFSPETIKKMREAKIGKPNSHKGSPCSEETRKKMSESAKKCINLGRFKKGNHPKTEFKKGHKPSRESIEKQIKKMTGKKHFAWKGNDVGYGALHDWIRKHKERPQKCEHCGKKKTTPRSIHWANIDHNYCRKKEDYISLCALCHKKYDIENNLIKTFRGRNWKKINGKRVWI